MRESKRFGRFGLANDEEPPWGDEDEADEEEMGAGSRGGQSGKEWGCVELALAN
jgi:hypothetical protein